MESGTDSRMNIRATVWIGVVVVGALGCPSAEPPVGPSSSGDSSTGAGLGSTGRPGATSTIPPMTGSGGSSSSSGSADTTVGGPWTGTTQGGWDDGPVCFQCCGNGAIDGTEQCDCGGNFCDPVGLNFAECEELINPLFPDRVYTGGFLDCNPASCQYNFNQCAFCGDTVVNGNETCEPDPPPTETCASLGLGKGTEPLPCDPSCQLDTSSCV